jgi:hypothetical protein
MSTDYLRNRPFLTVQLSYLPSENANTGKKGWQNEKGAVRTMEKVSFVDRINKIERYAVVIDIINSKVLKNQSSRSEEEVIATYLSKYREETKAALSAWARREAEKMRAEG